MIRWWDDADTASAVLAAVDGSDVEQGVGTAALGLHALAKAALAPLVASTLVDRVDIAAVLADLPLEPVSKALAEATRPLLREGADRYGVLLAADMAQQAAAGADHLVAVLTGQGMPMPLAVARAAEAVGLPAKRTGAYANVTKDLTLHPLVIADAADRALMGYAQALGRAEAVTDEELAKSEYTFRERQHPRDVEGRFATKGGDIDPALAREAKRKKRLRLAGMVGSIPSPAEAKSGTLIDLVRALRPKEAPEQAPRARSEPKLTALATAVREAPVEAPKTVERARTKTARKPKTVEHRRVLTAVERAALTANYQGFDMRPVAGRNGMFLPVGVLDRIADGSMAVSEIERQQNGAQAVVFSENQLENLVAEGGRLPGGLDWSKVGFLEFVEPQLPVTETVNPEGYGIGHAIAPQAVVGPVNPAEWRGKKADRPTITLSDDRPIDIGSNEPHFIRDERDVPVLRVEVKNLAHIEETNPRNVKKDLHRTVERWSGDRQSHLVTRDEGRFATAAGSPDQLRAAATARRRKRAALAGTAALRPVAVDNQTSLLELVQALRPPATAAREAPAQRPAVTAASLTELATSLKEAKAEPKGRTKSRVRTAAASRKAEKLAVAPTVGSKAEVAFAQNQAILMDLTDLDAVFDLHDLHFLDEDGEETAARLPAEYAATDVNLRSGHVREALDAWVETGSNTKQLGGGLSSAEAQTVTTDYEAGAYDPIRRGRDPGEGKEPAYTRPVLDPKTGKWDVLETTYTEPKLMLYGSPEVIAAVQSGDPNVAFRLESVAQDVHALAVHEGVNLNEGGPVAAALYAVKVTIAEGNRPSSTRPPGGA